MACQINEMKEFWLPFYNEYCKVGMNKWPKYRLIKSRPAVKTRNQ